ncbi:DUF4349 domain-containing protein [Streptomyces chattanoogensis]|uniref:DUF4349 domain-containing protein n=1 Tax=Streptomyces chattanoogensis TaxID=66876 RepID=UPI00369878AA
MRGVRGQRGAGHGQRRPGRRGAAAGMLLAASLAVAGCSGTDSIGTRADAKAGGGAAVAPSRAPGAGQTGGTGATDAAGGRDGKAAKPVPDQIIRTATLTVRTKDVQAALAKARTAVDGAGGYAADETTDRDTGGHDRSRIVLRVPPKEYDAMLGRLAGLGRLLSREVSAKDVTDRVVDVDSRLRTQRASVGRVRALMDRATSISDIVSLEAELSTRQANLESLEAELKSLKGRTGMATITLLLRSPDAPPAQMPAPDGPTSFGDALSGGWDAFMTAVRWVLVAIGALLPFAVAAALLYGLWRLVRRRLPLGARTRRRAAGGHGSKAAAPTTDLATDPATDPAADPAAGAPAEEGGPGTR